MSSAPNLDRLAAKRAQSIVESAGDANALDTLATKTLGVLQEQGVYAAMLYLYAQGNDSLEDTIRDELLNLLQVEPVKSFLHGKAPKSQRWKEVCDFLVNHVAGDLDTLLLIKDLFEQTLIYVRYGAKAVKEENPGRPQAAGGGGSDG